MGELGQERRLWGQAGGGALTVPGLGLRGALVTPGWEVVAEFKAGEGRDLVCDLVVPHSGVGVGVLGSFSISPDVLSTSRRHTYFPAGRYLSLAQ